jgi:hypothetical protein
MAPSPAPTTRRSAAPRTRPLRLMAGLALAWLLLGGMMAPGMHLVLEEHAVGADGRLVHVGCGSTCSAEVRSDASDSEQGPLYTQAPVMHGHLCLVLELAQERAAFSECAPSARAQRLAPAPANPWPAEVLGEAIARHRLAPKQSPPHRA